ncbi:prorelaxin H1 [Osmerus mordax]|uniref:Relaxin-3 n=1 Tax=Osmerus mordax TaxID=8014 RepID=C1BJY4_OSMMO|nr:Relaxin-3 precursor [Osmerus mordax]
MLLRLTSVILVCVCSMLTCVGAQGASKVVLPRDYGVKLCGREFIRAVIFTCGGSRWKRSLEEGFDPFHISSYSDITEGGDRLSWERGMEMGAPQAERSPLQLPSSSSPSLADLLVMLGAPAEPRQSPADTDPIDLPQVAAMMGGGAGEQGRSPTLSWPRPDRRKRNFSLGVAGMCCNQGCTKNDIGRLC